LGDGVMVLGEETSKHVVQVLRMKKGEQIKLTDGKGKSVVAEIINDHKKATEVRIISAEQADPPKKISIAISPIKNTSRFEWFLEKATEIGVSEIIPLLCERTEKERFRYDRMNNILISAMLQSQQVWLPILKEPVKFASLIADKSYPHKFIAHCMEVERKTLQEVNTNPAITLIGPEGDFTDKEVTAAIENNWVPVTLGEKRLRTETAGIVACVMMNLK